MNGRRNEHITFWICQKERSERNNNHGKFVIETGAVAKRLSNRDFAEKISKDVLGSYICCR